MGIRTTLKVLRRGPVVAAPFRAMAPHKPTLLGRLGMETAVLLGRSVDDRLKSLAQLRASSLVGCLW